MHEQHDVPLADRTTLRLGGPARTFAEIGTEAELIEAVAAADVRGEPLLVLGQGSNLVVADEGFAGTVIAVRTRGVDVELCDDAAVTVTAAAGEPWDDFVLTSIERGWAGVEALSGVPGLMGATPIQNVGAYGQEVADTITHVRTWDRRTHSVRTLPAADCGFGYRTSRFKTDPEAAVVLSVTFRFELADRGAPVRYAELANALGAGVGERLPAWKVRDAVLTLRRDKGMVLDEADHDTWSAGSFFTNPILTAERAAALLPDGAPRWEQPDGSVKTSAAWLIGRAGFEKGYGHGNVALSGKHALALTNRGGATTGELLALAREIRQRVHERTGVSLVNEPVTVGCRL